MEARIDTISLNVQMLLETNIGLHDAIEEEVLASEKAFGDREAKDEITFKVMGTRSFQLGSDLFLQFEVWFRKTKDETL